MGKDSRKLLDHNWHLKSALFFNSTGAKLETKSKHECQNVTFEIQVYDLFEGVGEFHAINPVGNALCGVPRFSPKAERQGRRSLQRV